MHKHSDKAAPIFLPDLLPSLLPLVVRATMPPSSREEDSARSVCAVYICMYIYIYLRCTRTGLDSIRARACMRACERAWTRERDRDRNREQERAQIGHGWSVRSSFQTTPSSPSPPPRFSATFRPFSVSPVAPYSIFTSFSARSHVPSPRPCPSRSPAAYRSVLL